MNKQIFNSPRRFLTSLSLLIFLPFLFGMQSCDPLISQNPRDLFYEGVMPRALDLMQNQTTRELSLKEKEQIKERVLTDALNPEIIKVAVIDSGVDVTHPDLIDSLDYKLDAEGNIISVGYDFMTGKPFGTNVLVDASLFAWGCKEIRGGRKIQGAPTNPLKILRDTNDFFVHRVLEGIQNNPQLKNSYFKYLSANSFTVAGMVEAQKDFKFKLTDYEKNKSQGKLINESNIHSEDNKGYLTELEPNSNNWNEFRKISDYGDQLFQAFHHVSHIEGGDEFIHLLQKSLEEMEAKFNYTENKLKLKTFMVGQTGLDPNDSSTDKTVNEKIQKTLEYLVLGTENYDPLLQLQKILQSMPKYKNLSFSESTRLLIESLSAQKEKLRNLENKSRNQVEALKKFDQNLNQLNNLFKHYVQISESPALYKKYKSELRRYGVRSKHPYLSPATLENIHATHVASTIARQHKDIRIIPIRVTTQSIALSTEAKKLISTRLKDQFKDFTKSVYFEPLKKELFDDYSQTPITNEAILYKLDKYLIENSLNSVFIDQLFGAIEKTGELGAHLANVSLGTSVSRTYDKRELGKSLIEAFFFEFARYRTGQILEEKAPKTLFFVAMGNDGDWIEGQTKGAFPASINSSRMDKIVKELNLPVPPNNRVKNLIPIASVSDNGQLTAFANLIISSPATEHLASLGERVRAGTPRRSNQGTRDLVESFTKSLPSWLMDVFEIEMKEKRDSFKNREMSEEEQTEYIQEEGAKLKIPTSFPDNLTELFQILSPIDRQSLSGTSMGTPSAVGRSVLIIKELLKSKGAIMSDLFSDNPGLSLSDVRDSIFSNGTNLKYPILVPVKILMGKTATWPRAKNERDIYDTLKRMTTLPRLKKEHSQKELKKEISPISINTCSQFFASH